MTETAPTSARPDWWTDFYDEDLERGLLDTTSAAAIEETLGFLERVLAIRPGDRVFDQCCGNGRLALPLARRGYEVHGLDQAELYIRSAAELAAREGLSARFEAGDAFEQVCRPAARAALNWWTSFGYAPTAAENRRMIVRAFESLQPGAAFALDWLNVPGILRGFQRDVINRVATPQGELVLLRESRVDLAAGRLLKTWTWLRPDGERVRRESSVRLYLPHELRELFEAVGFVEVEFFGDTGGAALELDSPRCIVVGRRPGGARG